MAMAAMLLEIALVVFLGLPEGGRGLDLGDDQLAPLAGGRDLVPLLRCHPSLLWAVGKDHRAVLGAEVRPLAVLLGGVVHPEEQLDEGGVGHFGGVKSHPHHLGMVGVAATDLAVGGVVAGAAGIAADRVADAGDLAEEVLHPPEAARAEECLFHDPVSAFHNS